MKGMFSLFVCVLVLGMGCNIQPPANAPTYREPAIEYHRGLFGGGLKVSAQASGKGLKVDIDPSSKAIHIEAAELSTDPAGAYGAQLPLYQANTAAYRDYLERGYGPYTQKFAEINRDNWQGIHQTFQDISQIASQISPLVAQAMSVKQTLGLAKIAISPGAIAKMGLQVAANLTSGPGAGNAPEAMQFLQANFPEVAAEAIRHAPALAQYTEPVFTVPTSQPTASTVGKATVVDEHE